MHGYCLLAHIHVTQAWTSTPNYTNWWGSPRRTRKGVGSRRAARMSIPLRCWTTIRSRVWLTGQSDYAGPGYADLILRA
jgi:hypothetical protein